MSTVLKTPQTMKQRIAKRWKSWELTEMFERAIDENAAGDLVAAREVLLELLGHWLRMQWVTVSGKAKSGIINPDDLLEKLRASLAIDNWTYKLIKHALRSQDIDKPVHVDMLFGIVSATCFGFANVVVQRGGAS